MTGWNNLPNELRDIVRGHIFEDIRLLPASTSVVNPISSLPLVNREFQHYFSHVNFRILFVDQHRLDDFERFLDSNKARQHTVEQIYLRVKLPEYDCSVCQTEEDFETVLKNRALFYKTLKRFFKISSRWADPSRQPWVTLDIAVYSPSDGKHAFRDFRLSPAYHHGADGDAYKRHRDQLVSSHDDPCPGWQRAMEGKMPLMGSKRRLLSRFTCPGCPLYLQPFTTLYTPLAPTCNRNLAIAPIFSTLHLSRHYYRRISPHLLHKIMTALPGIRTFHWETWQQPSWYEEHEFGIECASLLGASFPASIRHLSLHHHMPAEFRFQYQAISGYNDGRSPLCCPAAIRALARLESLGLSNVTQPGEFFTYCQSLHNTITWNRLKRFVFVSHVWSVMDATLITQLLAGAGRLAFLGMPLLENMEIWCAKGKDRLCLRFSYTADHQPKLEWWTTLIPAWEQVAQRTFVSLGVDILTRYPARRLVASRVEQSQMDFTTFEEISRLSRNPELILLPESRTQLHFEEQFSYKNAGEPPRKSRVSKV